MTADNHPETSPPMGQLRNLDLPLIDDQGLDLWAEGPALRRDRSVWPALTDSLSEKGRKLLWDGLREAVDATPGDPERALMVVEAFWRTMQIRRGLHYERRMAGGGASRVYGPGELRREIEEKVSSA